MMNIKNVLDFTIVFTAQCNLCCDYCKLINLNKEISYDILESYIDFFSNNLDKIKKKWIDSLDFLLFWWEPLLCFEKIKFFIEKIEKIWFNSKFKIYTNLLLLDKEKVDYFFYKKNIEFFFSIDWNKEWLIQKRFKNIKIYNKFYSNLIYITESKINFNISKVLYEKESLELFNNLKYLYSLSPKYINIYLVWYNYNWWFNKKDILNIIKWLDLFINYLYNIWYSYIDIIRYLWLESFLYNNLYDIWIMWDIDWNIYSCLDWLSIFSMNKNFTKKEINNISLWNIIKDQDEILNNIFNFDNFEEKTINILDWIYNKLYLSDKIIYKFLNLYIIKKFKNFINK